MFSVPDYRRKRIVLYCAENNRHAGRAIRRTGMSIKLQQHAA